jgi:hypothetical protein
MDAYQPVLIAAVAVVMVWFASGILWNLRRGNAVLKWIQAGLPLLGERTTLRWLGSSVVELGIGKAKAPFRRFELVVVMEPRDVPWLWLLSHARGRRDLLILRGQLNSVPRLEYEVIKPGSWSARPAQERAEQLLWGNSALGNHRFLAPKASLPVSRAGVPVLLELAENIHPTILRLAARREFPQFELHVPLPDPKRSNAHQFFEAVRALALRMAEN